MAKHMSIILSLALALVVLFSPAHSQITQTGCTPVMLTSFAPCMNSVSINSTRNGVSPPTSDCCNSIKSLMSSGTDCMCLIASGSPFKIPINQTMAMSLPRACNMPGVPLQCKAAPAAPIPAAVPAAFSPGPSPAASTSAAAEPSPAPATSALAPEADSTPVLTPPSSTGITPTTDTSSGTGNNGNTGSRPVLTPSAANISYQFSPFLLFAMLAATILKYCY